MNNPKSIPTMRAIIAGAIYAFAARLTCRDEPITLGSKHLAGPAAEACDEFLKLHGCSEGEPMVRQWQEHLDAPIVLTTQAGIDAIRSAMQADYAYAWAWHSNVAMAAFDEGLNHAAAQRAAQRFMFAAFGIDTSKEPS